MAEPRFGVVLFQLGGPDNLEAIEPFLYNLFCDPDIIDFPFARVARKPLARLISRARGQKVRHHYSQIGGGSPLRRFTEAQALALEQALKERGMDARCFVAMRYWHPFTREAIAGLEQAGCDRVVLLPLYPQYSRTTTGSSLNEWKRRFRAWRLPVHTVFEFYRHPGYIAAVAEQVQETLARFPHPHHAELVFSAHSVPESVIQQGDPYQRQIEETVRLVVERGGWRNRHHLCYQSKVGASRWLQPSLRPTIRRLAAEGRKQLCVVPIGFVSDHVETLAEIDQEARVLAQGLGIERFEMARGLNTSPRFIAALADLVTAAAGWQASRDTRELAVAAD